MTEIFRLTSLMGGGICLLLMPGFFLQQKWKKGSYFLFLLAFTTFITQYTAYLYTLEETFSPFLYYFFVPVLYLYGPSFFYFYETALAGREELKGWKFAYATPVVVLVGFILQYLFFPEQFRSNPKDYFAGHPVGVHEILFLVSCFHSLAYVGAILARGELINRNFLTTEKTLRDMLLLFLGVILANSLAIIGFLAREISVLYLSSGAITAWLMLFYLFSLKYPKYFLELESAVRNARAAAKQSFNPNPGLEQKLVKLLEQDEIYRDENLSLSSLAAAAGILPHQLSQYLNSRHRRNFSQYINSFRVEKAVEMMKSGDSDALTIAYSVGFKSKSNFYLAFRAITGKNPSEFRKTGKD